MFFDMCKLFAFYLYDVCCLLVFLFLDVILFVCFFAVVVTLMLFAVCLLLTCFFSFVCSDHVLGSEGASFIFAAGGGSAAAVGLPGVSA